MSHLGTNNQFASFWYEAIIRSISRVPFWYEAIMRFNFKGAFLVPSNNEFQFQEWDGIAVIQLIFRHHVLRDNGNIHVAIYDLPVINSTFLQH